MQWTLRFPQGNSNVFFHYILPKLQCLLNSNLKHRLLVSRLRKVSQNEIILMTSSGLFLYPVEGSLQRYIMPLFSQAKCPHYG